MADQSKNTGTGGINIDGKLYAMDVGLSDSEGGVQGEWSPGDVNPSDFNKDVSKPTKETFAKYLSKTTLAQAGSSTHKNSYPVGTGDSTKSVPLKINDEYGYPVKPVETTNEAKFASVNIGIPTVDPNILKKGLGTAENNVPDGNKILPTAAEPADPGGPYVKSSKGLNAPLKSYVSAVLEKNRFKSDSKYFEDYLTAGVKQGSDVPAVILSKNLSSGVSPAEKETATETHDFNRLAHVGTMLQLAATGEYAAVGGGAPIDPGDFGIAVSTIAPGVGQLGAGVPLPVEYLDVNDILRRLTENPISDAQLTDFSTKFEGVINSSFEKFSGFSSLGMAALVTVLILAIVAAFDLFGKLFPLDSKNTQIAPLASLVSSGFKGRLGIGTYYGVKTTSMPEDLVSLLLSLGSGNAMQFFGILPTKGNFSSAVTAGVQSTFGLDSNYKPVTTYSSSGYLISISRSIVRSVSLMVLQVEELGQLLAAGNVGDGAAKALEIISAIKNSRFIRCFNVFAQIGDKINDYNSQIIDVTVPYDAGKKLSFIDVSYTSKDSPASYGKSRLYPNNDSSKISLKLAWASNRTPDYFIAPPRASTLSKASDLQSPVLGGVKDNLSRAKHESIDLEVGRPSWTAVKEIEDKFEAEYMPFYFQDLRTNEILGFHAFLTNLTDEYTANYDSAEGIGRIDPIKTYKNTTRRLGVAFVVAATDSNDFDSMWEKINKLTTLVYPQYTKGKTINIDNGNYVIEKPFTQMIGASPMVRMRLGNLFTSNYSKFNIAGIFGLKDSKSVVNGKNFEGKVATPKDVTEQLYSPEFDYLLEKGEYYSFAPELGTTVDVQFGAFSAKILGPIEGLTPETINKANDAGKVFVKLSLAKIEEYSTDIDAELKRYEEYKKRIQLDEETEITTVEGSVLLVEKSKLVTASKATEDKIKKLQFPEENTKDADFSAEVKNFLNEDKNSITRSFRSAGGRGIAGFIDNISFDWNQSTWDVSSGRKAPLMCKVTMGFSPIHDISPGLDAYGSNRAPIYSLGPYRRKR